MLDSKHGLPAPEYRPLDHMAELSHVPRPGIAQQGLPGTIIDAVDLLSVLRAESPEKLLGEEQDIVPPFPERR